MKDFTLNIYKSLLFSLSERNYMFLSFSDYMTGRLSAEKALQDESKSTGYTFDFGGCLLRHDVDKKPLNSLRSAIIENELGIKGSYYFRIVPESYNFNIMQKIANLGHEIGYHYEDVDLVLKNQKSKVKSQNNKVDKEKLIDLSYENFCKNLEIFRKNFEIKTICMHGSPLSQYDNKIIWQKYNYKDLGLIGEPYFDIDWNEFGYFTDTGRMWDGEKVSVRDRVIDSKKYVVSSNEDPKLGRDENQKIALDQVVSGFYNQRFHGTFDIIQALEKNQFPEKVMITVHPQRWNDNLFPWITEYISQNAKNLVKKYFYVKK